MRLSMPAWFLLAYSIESIANTIAICVLVRGGALSSLTRPASAARAHVQSLMDEEVALGADNLKGNSLHCCW